MRLKLDPFSPNGISVDDSMIITGGGSSSSGGGAVDSVNGYTGVVVLGANDILPDQTGNNGKYLTTDGSNSSWATVSGGASPLTTKGDLYTYSTMDTRLPVGNDGEVLSANSGTTTGLEWIAAGGTGTVTSVSQTVPTGLTISGSPVTTTGTLALGLDTGYVIPLQSTLDTYVVGPASATDNAIARFNLTTGKLVQDSVVTIADTTGNMAGVGTINTLTLPSSNFVGLTDSQTLTTKTLTSPIISNATASTIAGYDGSKVLGSLSTATYPSLTELSYIKGVTSAIQTQLDSKGAGTVTSVSGTSNRITSSGGATPAIDISASYVGQNSITTLGTITTGTWNGTDIAVADGGTGRSTGTTAYSLIATGTTATGAQQTLANGATTEILVGGGASALPAWTTASGTGAPLRQGSPTITTPVIAQINDANGNEEVIFTATGSAVNELTVANAATGAGPKITSTGGDTNIDLNLSPKGSGSVVISATSSAIGKLVLDNGDIGTGTTIAATTGPGSFTVTLPAATDTLVGKATTDTLTNKTIAGSTNSVSYNTFTNPSKFLVYRNSAASIGAGFTKITFDTELFDTGSNFASGTFTAPLAGFYFFEWQMGTTISAGNGVSAIYKNGSIYAWGSEYPAGGGSNGSLILQAAANDTFEIYGATSLTATLNVGSGPIKTYFSGYLLSIT